YGVAALAGDGQISLNPPANFTSGEFLLSIEDAGRLKDERKITLNSGIVIETTLKSGKKILLPGQQEPLLVKISNHSSAGLSSGKLELKPASVNVVIQGDEINNIDIPASESRIFDSMFTLLAPDTAGVAQDMLIKTLLTTGQSTHTDRSSFRLAVPGITVNPPVIIGNNGIAEPGEEATLSFNIVNTGEVDAGEIECIVHLNSPFAAMNSIVPLNLGYLKAQGQKNARVKLKLNESVPGGRLINVEIIANSESAGQFTRSFPITLGKPDILVIDKDKNQNSAVHIEASLKQLNIFCDFTSEIDSMINHYSTIFLSLGFVNNHYILNAVEDTLLTSFLEKGGKLYLESGTFFKQAPTTMLKGKMCTNGHSQGWVKPPDTLVGFQGTEVEGFNIDYRGDTFRSSNLLPLEPSQPWFYDKNSELIFLSVLDSVKYKTIAAAFEFGGTFPFNGPDRKALMLEYLKFMEYPVDPFSVSFTPDQKVVCDKTEITFTAIASQQPQSWQWSFPGGTPETWDGPSPGVKYETAGTYCVSLTVGNGEEKNTFTLEDAIRVESCIGLEEPATHIFRVYPNPASDKVTIEAQGIMSNTLISISDMQGRVLVSQSFREPAMRFDVELGNASAGVYLATVKSDKISKTTKLIVH
ncbi:MAG TPA: T9SS type A sorting domain-containing protein, partial [Lentimicrobium sp.]|nr:T9SS type A sorting domain-containing protein [Lentimicrobium sp.]